MKRLLLCAASFVICQISNADTFGTGANTFSLEFATVENPANGPDSTGYGAVPYIYRIGLYEVTGDQVNAAVTLGLSNVSAGGGGGPAISVSWFEAASFVNWLNESKGYQAAYNLTFAGGYSIQPWSSSQAWQLGGENLLRNRNAHYFLPSENEWYKAAYHKNNGDSSDYWLYPTSSDSSPINITDILGSTAPNTARFGNRLGAVFVPVEAAGGQSPYGTRGQGGNAFEYLESAFDGTNDVGFEEITMRGGDLSSSAIDLTSSQRFARTMNSSSSTVGFRIASVPEPRSIALLVLAALVGWLRLRRHKQSFM